MSQYAVEVNGLSKEYKIGSAQKVGNGDLRDLIVDVLSTPFKRARALLGGESYGALGETETIWALSDITFNVKHGEVVGIIGKNGAGKSTLLKILSRITKPTTGSVRLHGRVGSLLEVGTGFHADLTGRENVYLNGAILGMSQQEIDRKFDEIVDFSGVEKFIDTPVKFYSSGMGLRLGFAVAAHLEPEILVVDEVLAVGDAEFQKKCIGKMSDVAGQGRTVLFVSHNMGAVQNLCTRAILLEQGKLKHEGSVDDITQVYMQTFQESGNSQSLRTLDESIPAYIEKVEIHADTLEGIRTVYTGQTIDFSIQFKAQSPNLKLDFNIAIFSSFGDKITHLSTYFFDWTYTPSSEFTQAEIICQIPKLPLPIGEYYINATVHNFGQRIDFFKNALTFKVISGDYYGYGATKSFGQKVLLDHNWMKPSDQVSS